MADNNIHITASMHKACEGCGQIGGKTVKWLCEECRQVAKIIHKRDYKRQANGRTFLPPVLLRRVVRQSVSKTLHSCIVCGIDFYPRAADRTKCCGRDCGLRWTAATAAANANGGRVFVRVNMKRKPKPIVWHDYPPKPVACRHCGVMFYKSGFAQKCCSDECSLECKKATKKRLMQTEQYKKTRKVHKQKRKALLRGANGADLIDPIKVFERDAWRCGICGAKTNKAMRGTYHPRAPELDHIVALANGGSHTWANVQCSCRACNGRKGASDYGQLMLFPAA